MLSTKVHDIALLQVWLRIKILHFSFTYSLLSIVDGFTNNIWRQCQLCPLHISGRIGSPLMQNFNGEQKVVGNWASCRRMPVVEPISSRPSIRDWSNILRDSKNTPASIQNKIKSQVIFETFDSHIFIKKLMVNWNFANEIENVVIIA